MPKRKRVQRAHTEDWQTIQQYTLWPEQTAYELLRPIVLYGGPAGKRAQETGAAERTLDRKADSFDEQGMVSLFASKPRKQPEVSARSLPPDMRQLIVDLRFELPTMSLREIAQICEVRFGRRPSHNSVKLVLASGPPPSITSRRYQTWDQMPQPAERRLAAIRLHSEGWSVASIAEYLGTVRQTIYTTLKRWVEEGVKGLEDKSHARKAPRVATFEMVNEVRKKQENPLLGAWRMHAALLQEGIKVSPRTCGRIMAKHRALYRWNKPKGAAKPKKEMPFKATRRHEYWSIDVRYIEHHQLPEVKGPVYVISILENFSRMLLASSISDRQDTAAFLRVFARALRNYGAPEAIVTDGGRIFYSLQSLAIYEALDIRKERIDPGQSWQNYIESHFGIMRRLSDYHLNRAIIWDEIKKAHKKFIRDYNTQIHFAHRERRDNRHSPQDVLRGVLARTVPEPVLARIFFATQFTRHLDRSGYIRFRRWRFYAEAGLARQEVQVSIYTSTLKVEYEDTDLAFYTVAWHEDNTHITQVSHPRLIETSYRSPQLTLWTLSPDEWLLFKRLPDYAPRQTRKSVEVIQLAFPEWIDQAEAM